MPLQDPIERRHEIALREVGTLATFAHMAQARADELQKSVDFLLADPNWERAWKDAPKNLPKQVMEGATDIGHDMMLEWGWYVTDDEDDPYSRVTNCLLSMFEIGFRFGAAFDPEPDLPGATLHEGETRSYANGRFVKLADGVPPYIFDLLFEQAVEAFWEVLHTEAEGEYWRGRADGALQALEVVLSTDEVTASQLVGSEVARKALDRG